MLFDSRARLRRRSQEGLRLKLTGDQKEQLAKYYTNSPDAYRAYLQGRHFLEKRTPGSSEKSIGYLGRL